ncbi:hypothetical protein [uncultured Amnibacterium sp.]
MTVSRVRRQKKVRGTTTPPTEPNDVEVRIWTREALTSVKK